ncbi:hypothetical protein LL662_004690 [Salmonella enterica]|nr:hypothetical protein [Salmonella enterica]
MSNILAFPEPKQKPHEPQHSSLVLEVAAIARANLLNAADAVPSKKVSVSRQRSVHSFVIRIIAKLETASRLCIKSPFEKARLLLRKNAFYGTVSVLHKNKDFNKNIIL